MKVTNTVVKFNPADYLNVTCDVHKGTLFFLARLPEAQYSSECRNRSRSVQKQLEEYCQIAQKHGKRGVRVVCEPTGEYDRILLRTARRLGCRTAYVNTENVNKFRQIETNDDGKTDTKDPHVIASLAEMERVLRVRDLDENYMTLRKLGAVAEDEEVTLVRIKGRLSRILVDLYCDYEMEKDFLYSRSGQALVKNYGCNPYRIVRAGKNRFTKRMKASVKWIRFKTLDKLWDAAVSSVLHELPAQYTEVLEQRIGQLYSDFERHAERKDQIEKQMTDILDQLRKEDPRIPPKTPSVISEKNLAKLLGETGSLADFDSARQLLRYAGINLRMRESGRYKGQTKTCKKGRARLRKVLGNIVLPLVKKRNLYGRYYHHKKEVERMCGNKGMMVVMRNFLRKFYGWYRSGGGDFDQARWFRCESEYKKAA